MKLFNLVFFLFVFQTFTLSSYPWQRYPRGINKTQFNTIKAIIKKEIPWVQSIKITNNSIIIVIKEEDDLFRSQIENIQKKLYEQSIDKRIVIEYE